MDLVIAIVVVGALIAAVVGLTVWARGGSPYDDGTAGMYVPYVPEPAEDDPQRGLDEGAPPHDPATTASDADPDPRAAP